MKTTIAFVVTAVALGAAIGLFIDDQLDRRRAPAIVIDDPRTDAEIVVSVEGAVATPGTYRLPFDARVQNALDAAGGATEDADLSGLNLAARLQDEERLVVPRRGQASPTTAATGESPATVVPTPAPGGLVNINTADATQLDTLPGIGPALAAAIIDYREENGPFATVDELAAVKGISLAMVDEIRALITV